LNVPQRSLICLAFGVLALLVAAPAFASTGSALEVYHFDTQPGHANALDLWVDVAPSEPATSSATIFVPAGYTLNAAHAVGVNVGTASVKLYTGSTPVSGGDADVVVADPSLHVGDPCAPGLHLAVWLVQFYAGGHNLEIPIYVDGANADLASKAAYTLRSCMPTPDALGGLRVTELALGLDHNVFTTPVAKGLYVWRALVTPYGPLPQVLKLASHYDAKRHVAVLSGSITAAGIPRPYVMVHLWSFSDAKFTHGSVFGSARTNALGRFTLTKALKKTAWFDAYINPYLNDGCDEALGAAPCTLETISSPPDAVSKVLVKRP
jgi:hypothetical protein